MNRLCSSSLCDWGCASWSLCPRPWRCHISGPHRPLQTMLLLHQETLALCFRNVSQCAVLINPRHVIETLDFAFNKNSNRCLPSTNQVFWSYHFILSCILHMYKTKPVKITYGRFQPRLLAARLYGGSCGLGGAPLCHRLQYLTPLGSIVLKYSRNILGPQRMSPHDFGGERSRF